MEELRTAIPADTLNIKINDPTFTTCSANNRKKKDRLCIIIHTEILYIVMMSSITAAVSRLPRLFKKCLRELLYFKPSVRVQTSASQPEIKGTESLKDWEKEKKKRK